MRGKTIRRWLGFAVLATACAMGTDVIDPSDLDGGKVLPKDDAGVDPDADMDGGLGRICRDLDDCAAPDLCTNAQACVAHRCVVVGGTAGCDDGVVCTDDSCDANGGRCVHAPVDARCPTGRFCAGARGCVESVNCERDSDCSVLGGDACVGTWSCDVAHLRCAQSAPFDCRDDNPCNSDTCAPENGAAVCAHGPADYSTDLQNCGSCGNACARGAHQTATCAAGACAYACETAFVDRDSSPANGCECSPGAIDDPDLTFEDVNCDGVDGDAMRGVFVSPRGDDANPGTMAMPLRSIAAAVTLATSGSMPRPVYAAVGRYGEALVITAAVNIYGGYDDARAWARTRDGATVIEPGAGGVVVRGVSANMELQLLSIQSAAAMMAGGSAYGIRVLGSSARVFINGCVINAAEGANGAPGMPGAAGEPGGVGGA
ncbi:MAG: RNA-binding protein, partial [Myxococcaceae bacterium]|nr:RNA-binding protein [Myxococcaceae bacterium]